MAAIPGTKWEGIIMIDTHVHYADELIRPDLPEIEKLDRQAGVERTICLPITFEDNLTMMSATEGYKAMYYAVGIHPLRVPLYPLPITRRGVYSLKREIRDCEKRRLNWETDRKTLQDFKENIERLSEMIKDDAGSENKRIVAIGETGIDIHSRTGIQKLWMQKISLFEHLILALRHDLPLVLHIRGEYALGEALSVMKADCFRNTRFRGVWHCFCGTKEEMELLADNGKNDFVFGIGGKITKPGRDGDILRKTLRRISEEQSPGEILSKLVLETDAPFVTPYGIIKKYGRDARNISAYLPEIVSALAEILKVSDQEVMERTTENANRAFFNE